MSITKVARLRERSSPSGSSRHRRRHRSESSSGLTRIELLAVLASLALLVAVALPALANNRERSSRVLCLNNLRLTGQGIQLWQTEHGGRLPWRTPWCEGGTMPFGPSGGCTGTSPAWISGGLNNNAWFQWLSLSNELRSPKILTCPSDSQKRPAADWDAAPTGGFLHPSIRGAAVSYLIGLDVFAQDQAGLVAGDRNVRFSSMATSCSSGVAPAGSLDIGGSGPPTFGLTSALHVEAGNFLFTDGSVEELSSQGFGRRIQSIYAGQDNGAAHYLSP